MSGSWAGAMRAALAASAGRPRWWVLALAAFLVRGGFFIVLLPLVSLPSATALATALSPTIEAIALGRQSLQALLFGTVAVGVVVGIVATAAYIGSWLDDTLAREAELADELDLRPAVVPQSAWRSVAIRSMAHLPTLVALAYGVVRIVIVTYQELLSPGDPTLPIAVRVLARAPDAIVLVGAAWLLGEAIGGLAARRAAEGEPVGSALRGALADLVGRRGVATFVVTDAVVLGVVLLLLVAVGQATAHVRAYLVTAAPALSIASALLLLVATWVLALAVLGAALAWRATAWTIEAAPRQTPAAAPLPVDEPATTGGAAG